MANFRPLTLQSGDNKQQQDADILIVGAGITTSAGNLTISSAGGTTTLSDTTVAVTNAATVGSTLTVTGAINANGGLERSTNGTLAVGTTANTTAITIGRSGILTTVAGDLSVTGTEAVTGLTTFTAGVTFNGTVTIGDGTSVDTLSFDGTSGFLGSAALPNVHFLKEVNHTLDVAQSTTLSTAGATLTISSGVGSAGSGATAGADGGVLTIMPGIGGVGTASANPGAGGALHLYGADAGGLGAGAGNANGGPVVVRAGAGQGGAAVGGPLTMDAGSGAGGGGAITIGATNAASIGIGRSGITTTYTGTHTIAASSTLGTTGSGNINLPQNASARFNIEGVATTANVTAANLNELTGGGATSLHSHAGLGAGTLVLAGQTLWSTPASGEIGYFSGDNTLEKCIATSLAAARFAGAYEGTAASVTTDGTVPMLFVSGLTSIVAGTPVFISAATAGRVTKTAPSTAGQVVAEVGILVDGSGYDNGSGSVHDVKIQVKPPVLL